MAFLSSLVKALNLWATENVYLNMALLTMTLLTMALLKMALLKMALFFTT